MKEIFESIKVCVYRAQIYMGYSKMKKHILVDELSKRFIVHNYDFFEK